MQIKKFESINVVPFIDIMLVILVIVLTTASFIAKGIIPIDLPKSESSEQIKDEKSLSISINESGEIYFDDQMVEREGLDEALKNYPNSKPIEISCDKNSKFEHFVYLLDRLKINDFQNFGVVTEYE